MKQIPVESFFSGRGQAVQFGDGAHGRFLQLSDREQGFGELFAGYGMQEVALVLVGIEPLEQFGSILGIAPSYIVSGRYHVGTERQGIIEESLELDLAVAQDVRIRRAPGLVLGEKVFEYVVPVFGGEVGGMQLMPILSQTACASARSSLAVQYSVPSSSSQFFMNRPST